MVVPVLRSGDITAVAGSAIMTVLCSGDTSAVV
jgi:hypothetical protein